MNLYTYISVLRIGGEGELMRCGKWATAGFRGEELSFREL